MKKIYLKAIAVGIAALLVIGILFAFAMFMADRDMKEYYKEPRMYDNDFVGLAWYLLFGVSTFFIMLFTGLFSAWWTSDKVTSLKETTMVAAFAAAVPLIVMVLLIMSIGFLLALSSSLAGAGYTITYMLTPLAQFSTCCLAYAFIAIGLSISGGLAYRLLLKGLNLGSIGHVFKNKAIIPGIAGGLLAFAICVGGYYLAEFSMTVLFLQFLLFTLISVASGAISGLISARSGDRLKMAFSSSIIAGLIVGLGGGFGQFMVAVLKRYNELGILMLYGPSSLFDGIVLAFIGGLLAYILLKDSEGRKPYANSAKTGTAAGVLIAVLILAPGILDLITSNTGPGPSFSMLWVIFGSMFSLAMYIIVAFAGALAVKYSRVKDLDQAMVVSCICGVIAAIFMALADAIMVYQRYVRYSLPVESSLGFSLGMETLSANYHSFLQGEPFKMFLVIGIAVFIGAIYGIWVLSLTRSGDNIEPTAAAEK